MLIDTGRKICTRYCANDVDNHKVPILNVRKMTPSIRLAKFSTNLNKEQTFSYYTEKCVKNAGFLNRFTEFQLSH